MDPLTIALAIYGGYQGYKSSKGGSPLARIAGTALGAYGGYNLGSGITGSAIGQQYLPSFLTEKVTPGIGDMFSGINVFNPANTETANAVTNAITNEVPLGNVQKGIGAFTPPGIDDLSQVGVYQPIQSVTPSAATPFNMTGYDDAGQYGVRPDYREMQKPTSFVDKATQTGKDAYSYLFEKTDPKTGEKVLDIGKTALFGVPALAYASGAFETEPYERSMFTYNVGYPELYRSRKFYTQDPKTGEVRELPQQDYIPEESAAASVTKPGDRFGPYKRETITLQQGGLATLNHFKDGGVTYLPSKTIHDEDDEDNYMRTNGYVEDDAGNGDKEEDTMLAQLADGEFVTRTDGVLGAGILAGANPKNAKEMRKLGAEFFYEQQKRFKRIYDLLDASRKATAH
jgi:hypothetical protein